MNKEKIEAKVCEIIQQKSGIEEGIDTAKLLGDYLNSITYIQFLIACEDEFDIEIDDDELDMVNFTDIRSVIDFIIKKAQEV